MNGRERILTALDGGEPDRIPCAMGFYRVDHKNLAGLAGDSKDSPETVTSNPAPSRGPQEDLPGAMQP